MQAESSSTQHATDNGILDTLRVDGAGCHLAQQSKQGAAKRQLEHNAELRLHDASVILYNVSVVDGAAELGHDVHLPRVTPTAQ